MSEERSRAWRRLKERTNKGKGMGSDKQYQPERKWKNMYTRKSKLARARQLGFDYPRKSQRQLLDQEFSPDEK